ncbi:ribonuclease D [Candidatus Hepatobacter penaei]|uniref:ribonuclease D n=1 Tax=Candidatus Hepatobacter penaei TaxID=1274402 RepID=UPI0004F315FC|nr:ribonuclease D [Candidatus Hepatobacter penaei]
MSQHITCPTHLNTFLDRAWQAPVPFMGIDTEFMRRTTYWPKLCLIQLASHQGVALLDPLTSPFDMTPLWNALRNPDLTKIFHAGGQDIEALATIAPLVIHNLFDIQVAAMLLNDVYMPSYQSLVERYQNVTLEKGQQTINWAKRPLSDKACRYALNDVRYLGEMFFTLHTQLKAKGRLAWMHEDMDRFQRKKPPAPWKIPGRSHALTHPQKWRALVALSAWREQEAQRQNKPKKNILADTQLMTLVHHASHNHFEETVRAQAGEQAWQAFVNHQATPPPPDLGPPTLAQKKQITALKQQIHHLATEHHMPPTFIATQKDIESYARGHITSRIHGWRQHLLGW